jgi:lipoprotein-releasing system ATP-binding protein
VDVLQGVDLDLRAGEMVAVVGASGVGKSTLLHVLGTLERPDHGEVFYYGENVFTYDDEKLAAFRNRTIGFVFQFHHLLPEFSALENTMMPALIHGINRTEAGDRAEAIMTRVGLSHRLGHHVGELSGGEQQRVAVARSLILKPSILLADEPTGNLDARTGESIHDLLISLNQEDGITAVVVTHNTRLAEKLSRRVTLIDGKASGID